MLGQYQIDLFKLNLEENATDKLQNEATAELHMISKIQHMTLTPLGLVTLGMTVFQLRGMWGMCNIILNPLQLTHFWCGESRKKGGRSLWECKGCHLSSGRGVGGAHTLVEGILDDDGDAVDEHEGDDHKHDLLLVVREVRLDERPPRPRRTSVVN